MISIQRCFNLRDQGFFLAPVNQLITGRGLTQGTKRYGLMSSYLRFPRHLTAQSRSLIVTVVTSASLAIAGCSADVTRFDFPISGFSDAGDDQTSSLQSQPQNTYPDAASGSDQAPSQDYGRRDYGGYDNSVSRSANRSVPRRSIVDAAMRPPMMMSCQSGHCSGPR